MTPHEHALIRLALRHYAETVPNTQDAMLLSKKLDAPRQRRFRPSPHQAHLAELQALVAEGMPLKHAARQVGMARSTAYRLLRAQICPAEPLATAPHSAEPEKQETARQNPDAVYGPLHTQETPC